MAWPDLKLGIEATSKRWHGALNQVRRDLARDAAITDLDWKLLYPEWRDAIDPATFVEVARRVSTGSGHWRAGGPHRAACRATSSWWPDGSAVEWRGIRP